MGCSSPLGPAGENASIPITLSDVYVLLGTNCVATAKCSYHNAGVYYDTKQSTVLTSDDRAWNGSARAFAPRLPAALGEQLMALAFSRDCSRLPFGAYCVQVAYSQVPLGESWYPVTRTVLDPATQTGPAIDELLMPQLLRFTYTARG